MSEINEAVIASADTEGASVTDAAQLDGGNAVAADTTGSDDAIDASIPQYAPYEGNWKRTMAVILTGQAFSFLTSSMAGFAVVWYLTVTTGSATVLALATLAAVLPQGLMSPYAGTVVDRLNRKYIMMIADGIIALGTLVLAALFFVMGDAVPVWCIFVLLVLRSFCAAFQQPAFQAVTPLIVPQKHLVRIGSITMGISSLTYIAGPALGVLAYEMLGMQAALLSDVIGAAIAITAIACVFIPNLHLAKEERTGVLREMLDGWHELRRHAGILALSVFIAVGTVFYFPIAALYPLMTAQHFGGGGFEASIVEGVWGLGMLIGSIILAIWGGGRHLPRIVCLSTLAMGAFTLAMGLLPSNGFVWFVALDLLLAVITPFFGSPYTGILQKTIEPVKLGRVSAFTMAMFMLASPLGLLLVGPLTEIIGMTTWFVVSGIAMGLIKEGDRYVILWPSIRTLDRQLADRVEQ